MRSDPGEVRQAVTEIGPDPQAPEMLVLSAVGRFPSTTGFVRDLCTTTQKSLRSASVLRIIFKQRSELIPFLTYLTEFTCIFCIL